MQLFNEYATLCHYSNVNFLWSHRLGKRTFKRLDSIDQMSLCLKFLLRIKDHLKSDVIDQDVIDQTVLKSTTAAGFSDFLVISHAIVIHQIQSPLQRHFPNKNMPLSLKLIDGFSSNAFSFLYKTNLQA